MYINPSSFTKAIQKHKLFQSFLLKFKDTPFLYQFQSKLISTADIDTRNKMLLYSFFINIYVIHKATWNYFSQFSFSSFPPLFFNFILYFTALFISLKFLNKNFNKFSLPTRNYCVRILWDLIMNSMWPNRLASYLIM